MFPVQVPYVTYSTTGVAGLQMKKVCPGGNSTTLMTVELLSLEHREISPAKGPVIKEIIFQVDFVVVGKI